MKKFIISFCIIISSVICAIFATTVSATPYIYFKESSTEPPHAGFRPGANVLIQALAFDSGWRGNGHQKAWLPLGTTSPDVTVNLCSISYCGVTKRIHTDTPLRPGDKVNVSLTNVQYAAPTVNSDVSIVISNSKGKVKTHIDRHCKLLAESNNPLAPGATCN